MYRTLLDAGVANVDAACHKISAAFGEHPNWMHSEKELREVRKRVTFAIYAAMDDLERVTEIVDALFTLLQKAYGSS